jgi:sec-independent protein translocase protein TatA
MPGMVLLFFDIGGGEILLIMLVALLLFGGDKLPELARGLGKGIRDFKDASEGVKREITNQIDSFEAKKAAEKKAQDEPKKEEEKAEPEVAAPVPVPVQNTMPISEIGSTAQVEPVENAEEHQKETPIEPLVDHESPDHHEVKS